MPWYLSRTNDVNENGAADERAFLGFGQSTSEGTVFSNGVAGWFGLHRDNFVMDAATGEVVSAIEDPGYVQYVNYANELYNANVALVGEGMAYQYGANCAGNYCAAHPQYPDTMMTVSTGDPDCDYEPMPIIQAIEGIEPHLLGQANCFLRPCDFLQHGVRLCGGSSMARLALRQRFLYVISHMVLKVRLMI